MNPLSDAGSGSATTSAPEIIPIAEKESIGYDQPSSSLNSELQARVLKHEQQIFDVARPQIEEAYGRTIEMTRVDAIYPYDAVAVFYRTTDEPVVAGQVMLGVNADGSVSESATIDPIDRIEVVSETVRGLFLMAYRPELTALQSSLIERHPQFTTLPEDYVRVHDDADPVFYTAFDSGSGEQYDLDTAAANSIYQAYLSQPQKTDTEWREIFDEHAADRIFRFRIKLMLTHPKMPLTAEMSQALADDLREGTSLPFSVSHLTVFAFSNTVVRDRDAFHEQFIVDAAPGDEQWSIQPWHDGYSS